MGKQHSSDNRPARRGPAGGGGRPDRPNRPEGRGGYEPRGNAGTFGAARGGDTRSGGRGNDRPAGRGEASGRPAFGQGGSKFGGGRPSDGGNRPSGRPSFGGNKFGDHRPSFGGDEARPPRRFEPREGGDRPQRDERGERPAYPPKPIWQGQPVRYEGKPTVPRGGSGERNRKFIKQNPDGTPMESRPERPRIERPDASRPASDRPAYTGRDERRSFEERGGSQSPRPRPEGGSYERRDDRRSEGGNRSTAGSDRPYRREGGQGEGRDERRPSGNRSEGGSSYGADRERKPYGERSPSRESGSREGSSYGADRERKPYGERAAGSFDKPRSTGEQPITFRERREALRAAESGPRSSTGYGRADKPKFGEKPGEAPDYKNLKHYENDKTRGNKRRASEEDFGTEELRLNRYIANAGICSRREADALIAAGEIRVNGEVITEMGYKVQPTDTVQYGKTNLNREKLVYVLLNKPKDFITTTDDPEGRKTVMSLIATASKEHIFPVGRLDRNTTGLLLFTNDGEITQKLTHPSHKNKKIYQAELDKPLTAEHLGQITAGLELEDGKAEVDDIAVVAGNPHFVGIELHSGRNRIVRRIFEHLGYDVVALDRVQYAGLTKKELPRGKWRFLSEQEVIRLKYFM